MLASGFVALLVAPFVASWLAQAEPAPPENEAPAAPAAPAAALEPPSPRPNTVGVHARFAYRTDDDGAVAPRGGFSLGATFERRYANVGHRLGLGLDVDLFFDRFSGDAALVGYPPRELTQNSFVVLQTLSTIGLPLRAWVGAGGGVTVAYASGGVSSDMTFSHAELEPVARGAIGVDLPVAPHSAVVVRFDYTHPLTRPTLAGFANSPFGDFVDVGLGFQYRF